MPNNNPYKIPHPITKRWYQNIYLTSNHWRWRRDQFLKRVGFICECCRLRPAMEIHHLCYDNLYCERDCDLVAMCWECHRKRHKLTAANDNGQLELPLPVP